MLNATLHFHLSKYWSSAAQDMLDNLYVDNIVSGCQSTEEALQYYHTARSIMKDAQFNLRSWAFNSHDIAEQASKEGVHDCNNPVNVLGLQWNRHTDVLSLLTKSPLPAATSLVTKRDVLSESSKVYDPLGLLSPVIIKAKIFIQKLWQLNVEWDEPLTNALKKVLGRSRVTLTALQTLVTEVEAILNDRPITYVSSELDDLQPLTPSHLLHGHHFHMSKYQREN